MIARYLRWLRGTGCAFKGDLFVLRMVEHALRVECRLVIDYNGCAVDHDEVF